LFGLEPFPLNRVERPVTVAANSGGVAFGTWGFSAWTRGIWSLRSWSV